MKEGPTPPGARATLLPLPPPLRPRAVGKAQPMVSRVIKMKVCGYSGHHPDGGIYTINHTRLALHTADRIWVCRLLPHIHRPPRGRRSQQNRGQRHLQILPRAFSIALISSCATSSPVPSPPRSLSPPHRVPISMSRFSPPSPNQPHPFPPIPPPGK